MAPVVHLASCGPAGMRPTAGWSNRTVQGKFAGINMARKPSTGANRARKPPKWVLHELWLEQRGEQYRAALFRSVKEHLPQLEALEAEAKAHWPQQPTYGVDSRSLEECRQLQPLIQKIAAALQDLLPDRPLRQHFRKVVAQTTAIGPEPASPEQGAKDARAILDAFYRAYCYLTMACEAGRAVELPGNRPPHWWTTLLYVFELS